MCQIDNCNNPLKPISISREERRLFLKGMVALPLAAIFTNIDLLHAQASKGEIVSATVNGGTVQAYLARAENPDSPVVILIHEWWGLNDHIKAMAEEVSSKGFHALAIDLFQGSVATDRDGAMQQIRNLQEEAAHQTITHWVNWAQQNGNGKVATLGWCFGGGWSLQASLNNKLDAAVIYYGNVDITADQAAAIQCPLLGHFGTLDESINEEMVGKFQKSLRDAGKEDLLTTHWYTANHAFANPTGGRYDEDDANLAWSRTHTFLASHLRT
jgi:carboxymethylenebutenolidase